MRSFVGRLTDGRTVTVGWTDRADGDFSSRPPEPTATSLRTRLVDRPWVGARQVHGAQVSIIEHGADAARIERVADVLCTTRDDIVLEIRTADCVAIGLWTDDGVVAAVHCGWRGLEAGVLDAAVGAVRSGSGSRVHAVIGPSIGPECYEFGVEDRRRLAALLGDAVVATTGDGRPALDVRRGVRTVLDRLSVEVVAADDRCTACEATMLWSHRARADEGRQALAIWIGGS